MIEVVPAGNRWTWRMIGACGRDLVTSPESYPCDHTANAAAKHYRAGFFAQAEAIDVEQYRR